MAAGIGVGDVCGLRCGVSPEAAGASVVLSLLARRSISLPVDGAVVAGDEGAGLLVVRGDRQCVALAVGVGSGLMVRRSWMR